MQVKLPLVDAEKMAAKLDAGVPTVRDILGALAKPGRDPREDLPAPLTRKHVVSLEDIKVGTIVKGTVHNVVDFGAFVDFGLKRMVYYIAASFTIAVNIHQMCLL